MALIVGAALALAVGLFASLVRLDRERSFYATVAIIVATYNVLFAVMGASTQALLAEIALAGAFVVAATVGFRHSQWIVCAALAGHGVLDLFHHHLVDNPGVPAYWPDFCMAYDVAAAAYLAARLLKAEPRSLNPA